MSIRKRGNGLEVGGRYPAFLPVKEGNKGRSKPSLPLVMVL